MRNVSGLNNNTIQQAGQGDAYVFSPLDNTNLMHAIYANKADEERKIAAKAKRDSDLADELKYNHEAIYSPYAKEHEQKALDLLKLRSKILSRGTYDPTHPDRIKYDQMKNELTQDVAKGKEVYNKYLANSAEAKAMPYTNQASYQSELNNAIHGEDGVSRLPIGQVNPSRLDEAKGNHAHLNSTEAFEGFAKSVPVQKHSYVTTTNSALGQSRDERIVDHHIGQYDVAGNPVMKNGKHAVDISPDLKASIYQHEPRMKGYVQNELQKPENKGKTEEDILSQGLSPFMKDSKNINPGTITKWDKPNKGSGNTKEEINARHESLQKILGGDEIEQGNIMGGQYGGKKLIGVEYVPAKGEGEAVNKTSEEGANKISGSKSGIVKFKILGKDNQEETIDVPYKSKEQLYYLMNNIYNTSAGQNKISNEELIKNRGTDQLMKQEPTAPAQAKKKINGF